MIYWLTFLAIIGIIFFLKKDSNFYLKIAFFIFLAGAILRIVGLNGIAEILMRISFLCWIVGLFIAIREIN